MYPLASSQIDSFILSRENNKKFENLPEYEISSFGGKKENFDIKSSFFLVRSRGWYKDSFIYKKVLLYREKGEVKLLRYLVF